MNERKFTVKIHLLDGEAPEDNNEAAAKAFKNFLEDCLGDLNFDVKSVEVTCE
jgi:hypothetical protein